jgi:hypothetical protein
VTPTSIDELIANLEQVPGARRVEGLLVVPTGVAGPGQIPVTRTYPGDIVQLLIAGLPTTWHVARVVEEIGGGAAVYATAEGFAEATEQPQCVNQLRSDAQSHDEPTR